MSAPHVLTNAVIWLGGYDLSGASNEVTFGSGRQELADNRFGDEVDGFYPGPLVVGAEAKGFFDTALDGPLTAQLLSPTEAWPLTICPDGGDDGELAYNIRAYLFGYSVLEAAWGQSLPYRLSGKSKSGGTLDRGSVMFPKATRAASAAGTKKQIGALSAAQKLVAVLHVFSITGGTWAFAVESDADAAAGGEVVRGSFASVTTAPGRQVIEVAGPVTDTWWRVNMTKTLGTDVVAAVSFAIVDA